MSDQIRDAIDAIDMSRYAICKHLDLAESTMSRFMSGRGGLSMNTLDALSELLDLNLVSVKRRRL